MVLLSTPFYSEACLFFSSDLLRLRLLSVQYDLQHGFAWVADEADPSVVLALQQVAFLGKCNDRGLGPQVGHSPVCQILPDLAADCRESGDYVFSTCLDSFAGMSTPADFPFFNDRTAASTSLRRMG